jgi:hypothetical protein
MADQNKSEVARLRAQIEAEYAAAYAGLHGLSAGSSRHDTIQAKIARAQEYSEQLIAALGEQEAMPLIVEAMDLASRQALSKPQNSQHSVDTG